MAGCLSSNCKPTENPTSSSSTKDKGKDPLDGFDPWTVVSGQFMSVMPVSGLGPAPKSPRPTEVKNRFEHLEVTDHSESKDSETLKCECEEEFRLIQEEQDMLFMTEMLDREREEAEQPTPKASKAKTWLERRHRSARTQLQRDLEDKAKYMRDIFGVSSGEMGF
mgnify:CR=1 FL=1